MKKKVKEILIIIFISSILFIIVDFLGSSYLVKSSESIYEKKKYGYYELSDSFKGFELFGSTIYKVFTDKYGFRSAPNSNLNEKYNIIFLGDSATYGMMNWEESLPGIFQIISNQKVLNAGVPSYSPTTYLHRYKKALDNGLLKNNHIVIIALDISDVQDEAGHWMDPDYLDLNNVNHPINMSASNTPLEGREGRFNIKKWIIENFRFSIILYRVIKFNITGGDYLEPIFNTSRSAFTWKDFNQLNKLKATEGDNYTRGYLPLGVEGGLKKIKKKLIEINKIVKSNNGKGVYFFTYPWPAQVKYKDNFGWLSFVNSICLEINCLGSIDIIEDIIEISNNNNNWYKEIFLNGDIHLNSYGNKIAAEKILNKLRSNN